MVLLNLDRNSKTPLFLQVYGQLKGMIDNSTLKPGTRLPPTRALAERLGINRSTVYKAYEELWAMGYLRSRPGSYSIVRKRQTLATKKQQAEKGLLDWDNLASAPARQLLDSFFQLRPSPLENKRTGPNHIDMGSQDLDSRLFPVRGFKRAISEVMSREEADLFRYGNARGYRPLREFIARRSGIHGISVTPDEILITNGAQNAFELILKFLASPDKPVVVEAPTYYYVIQFLKYYDLEVIEIPMTPQGMDLDALEKALKKHDVSLVYTMPNFHNPTGVTTDQIHRERLLALCEQHRVPLVEDAFEEEMKYFGRVSLPIKSMDKQHVVMYLGSFSKVFAPGLRLGWVAAERECIDRLKVIKQFGDLSTSTLTQAVLAEFCLDGGFDLHIKRLHRVYKKRMGTAIRALKRNIDPTRVFWREPEGGYLIWLELKGARMPEDEMKAVFKRRGIRLAMGRHFFPGVIGGDGCFLRLSIAMVDEEEIEDGVKRLAGALDEISAAS